MMLGGFTYCNDNPISSAHPNLLGPRAATPKTPDMLKQVRGDLGIPKWDNHLITQIFDLLSPPR